MDFEKERIEALQAGMKALDSLNVAYKPLEGARKWGIYDTFFGGGLISGIIKHSRMEEAQRLLKKAKADLQNFSVELKDLELSEINLQTDDFLGFADIFFDGFWSDFFMQKRISDACRQVEIAIDRTQVMVHRLERMEDL